MIFKNNKAASLRMIQNQLRVKEADVQEDTYNQFRDYLETPPYVSRKGMEEVLRSIGAKDAKARSARPEDFMDMRFVAELEKEGFFQSAR